PTPANSFFWYVEGSVDPNFGGQQYALGATSSGHGLVLNGPNNGAMTFSTQAASLGVDIGNWWQGVSAYAFGSAYGATAGTNYNQGYYPFAATDGGCAREPAGYWWAGN